MRRSSSCPASPDDGVRVPDVYRCHFEAFAVYLERFGLPHVGFAEVDLDILALDARGNGAFSDVQPWECDAAPSCKPHGGNASAVPGKLSGRPVRVPDDDLCLCTSHFADLQHTVGAHPAVGVAEPAHVVCSERSHEIAPLDQQVGITERLPLRESHPPPRSKSGLHRS